MTSVRPLFVVAGVGLIGTGASTARLFAQKGYNVALISRGHEALEKLVQDINQDGGVAASIPVADYSANSICAAFKAIRFIFPSDTSHLRVALFNAGYGVWKPFLNITDDDLSTSLEVNVTAAFAFSREVITEFLKLGFEEPSEHGQGGSRKRGTLLFTGATASIRGSATTSAFSAGKQGLRALSQSLAKEFGKQNIHVRLFTLVDYSFTYWHTALLMESFRRSLSLMMWTMWLTPIWTHFPLRSVTLAWSNKTAQHGAGRSTYVLRMRSGRLDGHCGEDVGLVFMVLKNEA